MEFGRSPQLEFVGEYSLVQLDEMNQLFKRIDLGEIKQEDLSVATRILDAPPEQSNTDTPVPDGIVSLVQPLLRLSVKSIFDS